MGVDGVFLLGDYFKILLNFAALLQEGEKGMYRHRYWQELCGRLVSLLLTWSKYRLSYIQGMLQLNNVHRPLCVIYPAHQTVVG